MYKPSKITLFIISVSITNMGFAWTNHSLYAAAELGIFQANFNNRYLDQTTDIRQNIVQPVNQQGYTGGIAIGYSRFYCPNYYLGVELSGNIENHTASFQTGASTAAFSDNTNVVGHTDLTFVPGIMLSSTVSAYLKLGFSVAWLQDTITSPAGIFPVTTHRTSNNNAYGFVAGLRLTKTICKNMSLYTEADYHDYGSVDFPNFENFTATYTHSTRVYAYDVVLGVLYNLEWL